MNSNVSGPLAARGGHPILHGLVSFPIACFTCALLTDIAYVLSANMMWADFSAWLLALGMIVGVLAAIGGAVAWIAGRHAGLRRPVWPIALGGLLVLVIAFFNNLVHSRDAWTSVVPLGIALSALTVLVLLITVWLAFGAGYRRSVVTPYSGVRS